MLTGRGVSVALAAVLTWLIGRMLGIAELYAVAVACGAVLGLGVLYVRQTTSSVAARRLVETDRVVAGGEVHASLELRNDGRVPTPTLLVSEQLPESLWAAEQALPGEARFVIGGLGPGRVATAPYRARADARGRQQLGPVTVRIRDPFGVAERIRRYTAVQDVLVYPRIERLPDQQVSGTHMGSGSSDSRRVFATGDEFYTMREYVRGDDLRMVHWPSTAHRQTMMVRQMEQPWQAHATLHLDTRRSSHTDGPDGTLEHAVSIAASLVYHLADRGYAIRLVTDTDTGRGGPQPWAQSLDRLALLEPSDNTGMGPSVAATRGGEGLFVSVVGVPDGREDPAHHPDMRALFGVRGFGQRLVFVTGPRADDPRAVRAVQLLAAAGWQATLMTPGTPLAPRWVELMTPRSRHGARAGATG